VAARLLKNLEDIFIRYTDTHRQTLHDGIGRTYASHRAAKIVIILRCNPWAVGWSQEGTF